MPKTHRIVGLAVCWMMGLILTPMTAPAQNCLSEIWIQTNQTIVHGNSMAHDAITTSLLIPQINTSAGPIFILDAETGALTTPTLALTGLPFGPLGCFAIGADEGGRIFGHTHEPVPFMAIWDGLADDTPTSAILDTAHLFRNFDVHGGDGPTTTTIYAIGAADGGPIDVFTVGPGGGAPVLRETFGGAAGQPGGKAGVAADAGYPAARIYGSDGVATAVNGIHIWTRDGGSGPMTYAGDVPMPPGFAGAPVLALAFEPRNDGLIFALVGHSQPSRVLAINAKTFQLEGQYDIPESTAVGMRGSLVADRAAQRLYWYGRPNSSTLAAPLGNWGCLAYTIPPVRPEPTPTPTPTPSPTPEPNPDVELRALWVTRWDYTTTDAVRAIIKNAADYHFNVILFQTRGNATVFYESALEPWAWELTSAGVDSTGQHPGWNPLDVAIAEAHAAGLQLHAYMNTYPGWRETIPPPVDAPQLWNTHREWFACGTDGQTMWPTDWWTYWYTFLSPGHPEARAHIHAVYMEVLERYPEIDGLHYDYIRYPSEVGDYSWNPVDVALFTAAAGGPPQDKPAEWAAWKREQISTLVRENYTVGEPLNFYTMFSSAVLGRYSSGRDNYFQDSHGWLAEGVIDCVMPMLYTSDLVYFENMVEEHVAARNGRLVAPGIGVSSVTLEGLLEEIRISRASGAQGVALFAYSTLFPGGAPNAKAQALLAGPFSNVAEVPPMPWKYRAEEGFLLH